MNNLKKALENDWVTFGTWIQIPDIAVVEIIAATLGKKLDWICVDLEHGLINIESLRYLFSAIEHFGLVPIARIPKNDYIWIHKTLDAGAKGIIVPMIKNYEDVCFAARETFYPPKGHRSIGYSRCNRYGIDFEKYNKIANEEISLIIQVEHIEAINNANAVFSKPEIDGTFIGPLDLQGSIKNAIIEDGNYPEEQVIQDHYRTALDIYSLACEKFHLPKGMHIVHPTKENIEQARGNGYKMIALGIDVTMLYDGAKEMASMIGGEE